MTEAEEEFREFAAAVQGHLRRSAYLLCGDWHLAEDLVQAAFVKIFQSWRRVRAVENRHAYARQVVFRCFLDHQRKNKRRITTVPLEGLPEPAAPTDEDAYSGAVLEVLATLPPGARAVIVLRFWEDLSVEQTASVLGVSAGTVKSQTSRAIGQLRERLGKTLEAYS